jgi:arylsulfatase A-like enzyme
VTKKERPGRDAAPELVLEMKRIALLSLLLAGLAPWGWTAPAQRPDIFLFLADDWGRQASCYADPKRPSPSDIIKTPNIDRIGKEGVRFNNAFYPCPQCTPSRAAIVSGCYFWRCGSGAFLNGGQWRGRHNPFADLPRFPELLAASGYATAKAFKTLPFAPTLKSESADSIRGYLRYGLHVSAGKTEEERARLRQEVVAQTRSSIRQVLNNCPANKPFFFVFGPINTHRPFARGSGKLLWGIHPDSLRGKLPPDLPDVEVIREDMADTLGEVLALDLMVGIFYEELQTAGRLENTLFVLTGDNGVPGFPRGKTQMYDLGSAAPLLVRWPAKIKPGRTVEDIVNLMDLAPTFLEAAGLKIPATMDGRSLMPQLVASRSGWVEASRQSAVFGRERHYADARPGHLPYPSRAIRTPEFLYIRNFKPDRWPLGEPTGITGSAAPAFDLVANYDLLGQAPFRDCDASPTKGWLVEHRADSAGKKAFELSFGTRPAEELYDLRNDAGQISNVIDRPAYAESRKRLSTLLLKTLTETRDPRLTDAFDRPPWVERAAE